LGFFYAVEVLLDCVIFCWFLSILLGGGGRFSRTRCSQWILLYRSPQQLTASAVVTTSTLTPGSTKHRCKNVFTFLFLPCFNAFFTFFHVFLFFWNVFTSMLQRIFECDAPLWQQRSLLIFQLNFLNKHVNNKTEWTHITPLLYTYRVAQRSKPQS